MPRSILILSGGLDSTVSAWLASKNSKPILALTFDYGQRAATREIESARLTSEQLKVPHRVMGLPWLKELTPTALVNLELSLPRLKESELDDVAAGSRSAAAVWVPNRNGLFLNIAACIAEAEGAEQLVTGFNAEEGVTFPDNSAPFVRAANEFFWYATLKRITVTSNTLGMTKAEIARKARELGIDLNRVWFCYEGGKDPCRRCESCLRAFRAIREAGIALT